MSKLRALLPVPVVLPSDPTDAQGAVVYDCRPPLLPVSLQLGDLGTFARLRPKASASVAVPPWEVGPSISDVNSDMVVFPELGVTPLIDSERIWRTSCRRWKIPRVWLLFPWYP